MAKKAVKKKEADKSKSKPIKANKKAPVKKATKPAVKSPAKKTITKKAAKPVAKSPAKKTPKLAAKSTTKKTTVKKTTLKKENVTAEVKKTKPKKKVKGYSKTELKVFKQLIMDKRTEIIEQLENLKDQMMDSSTGQYVNENSPYSLHMAEQGTDAQEREKLYLWAQRESKFLAYLEDALQRIELGTYGICIECMDEPKNLCPTCPRVPKERLMAVPHTQHCVEVKNAQSKISKR